MQIGVVRAKDIGRDLDGEVMKVSIPTEFVSSARERRNGSV